MPTLLEIVLLVEYIGQVVRLFNCRLEGQILVPTGSAAASKYGQFNLNLHCLYISED